MRAFRLPLSMYDLACLFLGFGARRRQRAVCRAQLDRRAQLNVECLEEREVPGQTRAAVGAVIAPAADAAAVIQLVQTEPASVADQPAPVSFYAKLPDDSPGGDTAAVAAFFASYGRDDSAVTNFSWQPQNESDQPAAQLSASWGEDALRPDWMAKWLDAKFGEGQLLGSADLPGESGDRDSRPCRKE